MQVQTTKNYRLMYRVHGKGYIAEVLCSAERWKVRKIVGDITEKVVYLKSRPTLGQIREI